MRRHLLSLILFGFIALIPRVHAQQFTVLYNLTGTPDGALPYAGLFRDSAGNLYGTTIMGGSGTCYNGSVYGCGTVFKLDPNGNETVLHNFVGGSDGAYPWASVVGDSSGNLYGTTLEGGSSSAGTVFKLDPSGNETILHSFGGTPDGANPYGAVIRDTAGNLYGTTNLGGSASCKATGGCGVVFRVNTAGRETVLYRFRDGTDGQNPYGSLWRDSSGNLYGTTYRGGTGCPSGCGTVFRIDVHGNETILYSFQGGSDGSGPEAGVIGDAAGNLYGTTAIGGSCSYAGGCGTVFRIDSSGGETLLYTFTDGIDGKLPDASLVRDSDGNLYGTTFEGDSSVFKLAPTGSIAIAHDFGDLGGPYFSALIRDPAGNLYGTTMGGGGSACSGGCGTVFKISGHIP